MTNDYPKNAFWPDDMGEDVAHPAEILDAAARELSTVTGGRIVARLLRIAGQEELAEIQFTIYAPALNYSHSLFSALYRNALPYPVKLQSEEPLFRDCDRSVMCTEPLELEHELHTAFASDYVRSVVKSLLSRVRKNAQSDAAPDAEAE